MEENHYLKNESCQLKIENELVKDFLDAANHKIMKLEEVIGDKLKAIQ